MEQLIPLLQTIGYFGFFGMLFAESGIFFGVIFPGDTLLFAAGLLVAKGYFHLWILIIGGCISAILGDAVGYWTGKKLGPKIFTKEESIFFRKEYITRAQVFFEKHGKKTIFFARFVPVVRTFAPILAGVAGMRYKTFFIYNAVGAIIWCAGLILVGDFLGTRIKNIDAYILPIVGIIFVISFIPVIREFLSYRKAHRNL